MSSIVLRELHATMFKESDVDLSTNDLRELHASIFKKDQMQVVDTSGEKRENRLKKNAIHRVKRRYSGRQKTSWIKRGH